MSGAAEGQHLSDRQRLSWLRLIRSENVGPLTFRDLVNRFGSAETALEALPDLVRRGGGSARICTTADAAAEIDAAARFGAAFVAIGEPGYPPLLRQIHAPPPLLAVKGETGALALPGVAIVGARNASLAGIRFARGLAHDLGAEGYAVASGLARGIDAAAHTGSMDTGTVAAMAGGLDRPYPPEHAELAAAITQRGALISEMPFGWEPRAKDFPRRNRLIAGLAHGLVVIEAALRSGSLISARLAGEFGRLVFAVPGSPLDPRSAGTNGLLKDGAILVTEAADVLAALAPQSSRPVRPAHSFEEPPDLASAQEPGDGERGLVLEALSPVPTGIDEIVRHTGLHPAQVHLVLLELQLAARLERHSGGAVSLLP
jgi:DNA processing protein